jgi:hypothetical protein
MKKINYYRGQPVALGADIVIQPLPVEGLDQHSPFLLIHHFGPETMSAEKRNFRVPPHPHRGFQPVTLVFSGVIRHKDSLGNDSSIGPGGVQWISAGKGIVHSEEADPGFIENGGGPVELIQLWINVPSKHKMDPASYMGYASEHIPELKTDNGGNLRVFGGVWNEVKGVVKPLTPLTVAVWEAGAGDKLTLEEKPDWNYMIYCLKGRMEIEGSSRPMGQYESAVWTSQSGTKYLSAHKTARALILGGQPINEPVSQYGPFVMNNQTEIMQAIRDYNMGKMGILVE